MKRPWLFVPPAIPPTDPVKFITVFEIPVNATDLIGQTPPLQPQLKLHRGTELVGRGFSKFIWLISVFAVGTPTIAHAICSLPKIVELSSRRSFRSDYPRSSSTGPILQAIPTTTIFDFMFASNRDNRIEHPAFTQYLRALIVRRPDRVLPESRGIRAFAITISTSDLRSLYNQGILLSRSRNRAFRLHGVSDIASLENQVQRLSSDEIVLLFNGEIISIPAQYDHSTNTYDSPILPIWALKSILVPPTGISPSLRPVLTRIFGIFDVVPPFFSSIESALSYNWPESKTRPVIVDENVSPFKSYALKTPFSRYEFARLQLIETLHQQTEILPELTDPIFWLPLIGDQIFLKLGEQKHVGDLESFERDPTTGQYYLVIKNKDREERYRAPILETHFIQWIHNTLPLTKRSILSREEFLSTEFRENFRRQWTHPSIHRTIIMRTTP